MKTKVWLIALVKDPTHVSKATQWFFSGYLPTSPWFQPWVSRGKRSRNKKLGWQGRRLKACPVAWGITWVNNQRTTPWELCFQSWEAFWSSLVGLNSPNILHPIPLPSARVLSCFSRVQLFVTPWTIARQAPLSTGFSRQEHWSGLPCPPPGNLPNPGIESTFLMSPAQAGKFFITSTTWEALPSHIHILFIYFSPWAISDKTC